MCVSEYVGFHEHLVCCVNFVLELALPVCVQQDRCFGSRRGCCFPAVRPWKGLYQPGGGLSFIAVGHRRSPEVGPSSDWPALTGN